MTYRITFLGTGTSTGVPLIGCQCRVCRSENRKDKRLRASVLVEVIQDNGQRAKILIDAGPDFRQQMLTYGIDSLDAILLTHEHRDHIAGLDDVRAFNFLSNKPVPIYAEQRVLDSLRKQFDYAFSGFRSPGLPEMTLHPINNKPFYVRDIPVIPVRAMHGPLPIFGFRIGPIGYLTDAKTIENKELEKFRGVEIFVVNTVQRTVHRTHFSLSQALDVARDVGAPESYLTHLSHCLEPHEELLASLPQGIEPAYDGLIREVVVRDIQ
jgi:phosphoribosyl 1,2-cyclic phosphate phosphodiesterase